LKLVPVILRASARRQIRPETVCKMGEPRSTLGAFAPAGPMDRSTCRKRTHRSREGRGAYCPFTNLDGYRLPVSGTTQMMVSPSRSRP
jgi:hypothetical protein